jgi:Tfp pilus assembly protein PilV
MPHGRGRYACGDPARTFADVPEPPPPCAERPFPALKAGGRAADTNVASCELTATMRTHFPRNPFDRRARGALRRSDCGGPQQDNPARGRAGALLDRLAQEGTSESGVSLIEVVISTLLVSIIAVGTLTGFDGASRATATERQHNQATLLAAQDEERLRGMNVTALSHLGSFTNPPVNESGTEFTVESKARFVSAEKEEFTCESTGGSADFIQTTSSVTWRSLTKKPKSAEEVPLERVSQSSIVPIPTSTSLQVNVHDQANEPVEGATVKVTGQQLGTVEQTTPESGCVIFGALPDSEVSITATKAGWINEHGEETPSATEAKLSTTSLVTKTFVIANPGSIVGEFVSGSTPVAVQGDTMYVTHTSTEPVVAGTQGTYAPSVTATGLFPFQTPGKPPGESKYTAYAGDCKEDPVTANGKKEITDPAPQVNPGAVTSVKIEVPAINVTVYEGTSESSKGALDSRAEGTLTNLSCSASAVRPMKTTSLGTLEHKYQPYAAKMKLCLAQTIGGNHYRYTTEFANNVKAGITLPNVFMASATKTSATC